jgi:hypothetical protein
MFFLAMEDKRRWRKGGDGPFLVYSLAGRLNFPVSPQWSPTGKARGTSITYPPTPAGAKILGCAEPRLRRVIHRWRNPPKHQSFGLGMGRK